MTELDTMFDGLASFLDLGGPVVALLLLLSVFALTVILLKLLQFWRSAGVAKVRLVTRNAAE